MININDLNLKSDILPFYNFTKNKMSLQRLEEFLSCKPNTLEIAVESQKLIQYVLNQKDFIKNYHYNVLYLSEAYYFMHHLQEYETIYLRFVNPFNVIDYSKVIQTLMILHQIKTITQLLEDHEAPEKFKELKKNSLDVFEQYEIEKHLEIHQQRILKRKDFITIYQKLFKDQEIIKKILNDFMDIEIYYSIAKAIQTYNYTIPTLTIDELDLKQFYHPKLKHPVKNDFKPTKHLVLLSGANMSGKSTFFKSVALCIYLGNLGLPIPAESSRIPFYNSINIRISHQDDITNGYSHFMNEIVNLKEYILQIKSQNNVVGFYDELYSGTNTHDAMELFSTTIKGLSKINNGLTFISSHIHELKDELELNEQIEIYHLECKIKDEKPLYTYQLKEGYNAMKIGQIIFRNEGLYQLLQ